MTITVYGRDNCDHCMKAQRLLERYGLAYDYFKVGVDIPAEEVQAKAPTARTVPVIFFGDEYIGGADQLERRLDPSIKPTP